MIKVKTIQNRSNLRKFENINFHLVLTGKMSCYVVVQFQELSETFEK